MQSDLKIVSSVRSVKLATPLDTETALSAAELSGRLKLATADAIVYATALRYGSDLVTCDAHFDGLPGVIYLPKTATPSP